MMKRERSSADRSRSRSRSRDRSRSGSRSGDRFKRPRREFDFSTRLLVPTEIAGSLIGKQGSTVKALRSEYSVHINIPDSNTPDRIVLVAGDLDNVMSVIRECVKKIDEIKKDRRRDCDIRLLVHQSVAGAVIGKGGAEVKRIREETRARVTVYATCCPRSTDRVVKVNGELDEAVNATKMILQIIKGVEVRGETKPYHTSNYDPLLFNDYGGYPPSDRFKGDRGGDPRGFDARGPPLRGSMDLGPVFERRPGGRFDSPPRRDMGGFRRLSPEPWGDRDRSMLRRGDMDYGRGFGGARDYGGGGGRAEFMPVRGGGYGGSGDMLTMGGMGRDYGGGMDVGRAGDFGRDRDYMAARGGGYGASASSVNLMGGGEPIQAVQVTVPEVLAGAIIGKRGENIRTVRAESGADVTVRDTRPGDLDRVISIQGTTRQIQLAQHLLQQSVRSSAVGRKYISDQSRR